MEQSTLDTSKVPYVLLMEDALPTLFMDRLIRNFDKNDGDYQISTDFRDVRHFKEINISQHWQDDHENFVLFVQEAWKVYMGHMGVLFDVQWPRQFGYEQFRMKRYLPNGRDQFALHTDVGSHASSRRFLSFLWYLNTPTQGGETGFGINPDNPDLIIPATAGRLLMFPPLWTHPHWGAKVQSGPKYIVSGYLHYI